MYIIHTVYRVICLQMVGKIGQNKSNNCMDAQSNEIHPGKGMQNRFYLSGSLATENTHKWKHISHMEWERRKKKEPVCV